MGGGGESWIARDLIRRYLPLTQIHFDFGWAVRLELFMLRETWIIFCRFVPPPKLHPKSIQRECWHDNLVSTMGVMQYSPLWKILATPLLKQEMLKCWPFPKTSPLVILKRRRQDNIIYIQDVRLRCWKIWTIIHYFFTTLVRFLIRPVLAAITENTNMTYSCTQLLFHFTLHPWCWTKKGNGGLAVTGKEINTNVDPR